MSEWIVYGLTALVVSFIIFRLGSAYGYARCYEDMTDRDKRRKMERDEIRFQRLTRDD